MYNLDKTVELINANLGSIYTSLNINPDDISFEVTPYIFDPCEYVDANNSDVGHVAVTFNIDRTTGKVQATFDKNIHILETGLMIRVVELSLELDNKNITLNQQIMTACLENTMIHELYHIYQLNHTVFTEADVWSLAHNDESNKIQTGEENKFLLMMEISAIDYTFSKNRVTVVTDEKLKKFVAKYIRYRAMYGLTKDIKYQTGEIANLNKMKVYTNITYKN